MFMSQPKHPGGLFKIRHDSLVERPKALSLADPWTSDRQKKELRDFGLP